MSRITPLVRPNIAALTPYSTARDEYDGPIGIFLDANESPYENGYNRYPDPHQAELKARIGGIKGIPVKNLFLGNGSDEAIDLVFRIFCEPGKDNAVIMAPSYGMYGVAAAINDVEVRSVRLDADFNLDSEALLGACDERTKVIFLCSPNNPSGNAFELKQLLDICNRFPGVVVVDEAYADFSEKGSLAKEATVCPPDPVQGPGDGRPADRPRHFQRGGHPPDVHGQIPLQPQSGGHGEGFSVPGKAH